jgi:hypothetical protein
MNNLATELAIYGCDRGTKWANLVNLSTITKMQSDEPERGRPSTNSKEIVFQAEGGTRSGCSLPGYAARSGLA